MEIGRAAASGSAPTASPGLACSSDPTVSSATIGGVGASLPSALLRRGSLLPKNCVVVFAPARAGCVPACASEPGSVAWRECATRSRNMEHSLMPAHRHA